MSFTIYIQLTARLSMDSQVAPFRQGWKASSQKSLFWSQVKPSYRVGQSQ